MTNDVASDLSNKFLKEHFDFIEKPYLANAMYTKQRVHFITFIHFSKL